MSKLKSLLTPESGRFYLRFLLAVCVFAVVVLFCFEFFRILSTPITSWSNTVQADCAVVFTGGPGRVRAGFDLLVNRQVKKLIISGVYPKASLQDIFPMWPWYPEINEGDVVLEKKSQTTYGNSQQSAALIEALRCRSSVLVTSQVHMRRAYLSLRSALNPEIRIEKWSIPSESGWQFFFEAWVEAVKSLFYALFAY
ncbi:MAG: YdcF family protein [Bdellovibrionaceae bacterium]|nr:YdcF family protein [Pseudobdellovibrionaceae bacterium]